MKTKLEKMDTHQNRQFCILQNFGEDREIHLQKYSRLVLRYRLIMVKIAVSSVTLRDKTVVGFCSNLLDYLELKSDIMLLCICSSLQLHQYTSQFGNKFIWGLGTRVPLSIKTWHPPSSTIVIITAE